MTDSSVQSTSSDDTTEAPDGTGAALLSERYRLEGSLGEGGMGKVYRAEHILMQKPVAIKVLHRELSENEEIVARFHREARAAAALDHPNVCQATDFGQNDEGAFFLVMEYLEGATLQETIEVYGSLPIERALHITRQIASALAQAHQAGIVHRDLKPENIMLIDRNGDADTVKIMDFGIARLVATAEESGNEDAKTRLTRKGMIYGTPHYMSPEQIAGDDVDATTDIYALGVVLFEMLTGSPPYDGDNIARVMGQHVTAPIPSISERNPDRDFPPSLVQFVEHLLAKDREFRPQNASELVATIDEINAASKAPSDTNSSLRDATKSVEAITRRGIGHAGKFWSGLGNTERLIIAGVSAVSLFLLFAIVTVVAVLVFGSSERQAQAIDDGRQALLEDEEVMAAFEDAKSGDRDELDELIAARDDDPHLRYLSLEADFESGRSVDLLEEATTILDLDGRYAHEPELVERLVDRITSSDEGEEIRDLLARNLTSTVREALAERARESDSREVRDTAFQLLDENGQLRNLETWQKLTAEMRQTSGCPEYKEKIEEIVALGDSRAVPTLQIYADKQRIGCGPIKLSDCYSCIRSDLDDAIDTLDDD